MLIEAALVSRNLSSYQLIKLIMMPFYYGFGSSYAKAKSYVSYGSGSGSSSATLILGLPDQVASQRYGTGPGSGSFPFLVKVLSGLK
jgi:hypothetical protein